MPEKSHTSVAETRNIPDILKVPDGEVLLLQAYGKGVQIYTCAAGDTSPGTFTGPVPHAILLKDDRDEGDLVAIHFAGPTWQSTDGSIVKAKKVAGVPSRDPNGVDWLLLQAISNEGSGLFSKVTYIQRLYANGGKPPAGGCDSAHNQEQVLVEYSAHYLFYVHSTGQQ